MSEEGSTNRYDEEFLRKFNARPNDEFVIRHLLLAVPASKNPLEKISIISQAAMMFDKKTRKEKNLEGEGGPSDFEILNSVAVSFSSATKSTLTNGSSVFHIPWMFPETDDGYTKFIREVWLRKPGGEAPKLFYNVEDKMPKEDWQMFFEGSKSLPEKSFNTLRGYFLAWGVPFAMDTFRKLVEIAAKAKDIPEGHSI